MNMPHPDKTGDDALVHGRASVDSITFNDIVQIAFLDWTAVEKTVTSY